MNKKTDFTSSEARLDEKIENTLKRDFALPDTVKRAQQEAFGKIHAETTATAGKKKAKRRVHRRGIALKAAGTLAASAAVFSTICISNPAFAANIPLVGHVFAEIGSSLGFSGDYSRYATALTEEESEALPGTENAKEESKALPGTENAEAAADGQAADTGNTAGAETATDTGKTADTKTAADGTYSQTYNGVTVTLSEIYCNDMFLNVAMVIHSEEGFPGIQVEEDGNTSLRLEDGALLTSYNPKEVVLGEYLRGKLVDENTFAGVMHFDLGLTTQTVSEEYFEARDAFFETLGISREELKENPKDAYDRIKEILGINMLSAAALAEKGGPDMADYTTIYEIPEQFTVTLDFGRVVGYLAEASLPEMPQDLVDEYNAAMAEHGLDESNYINFTDEEKAIEHELFKEQHRKYEERYPDVASITNRYLNWWTEGDWSFTLDVSKNSADTQVLEINDFDESGLGVTTVTKTPFEIVVDIQTPSPENAPSGAGYFMTALDENGERLSNGSDGGTTDVFAVQNREIKKIDVYICDYIEYMSDIKGKLLSDENTDKKAMMDERALYHKEIIFED